MVLSELGQAVNESLEAIPRLNPGISLFGHVVMPDHVHFNCHLAAGLDEPLKVLGNAIRRFKNYTTKMAKILVERSSTISTVRNSTIFTEMRKCGEIKRYRRFEGWDYVKGASLFITIATEERRHFFGEVSGGAVVLTELGEKVREALEAIPYLNPGVSLFGYVVMPDHVHFNCHLAAGLKEPKE
jgi:REP element-mobilizing transposase RayT